MKRAHDQLHEEVMNVLVDILIVWVTIIWIMVVIWKHHKWVAVSHVPYFVWVSIATVLQLSITWMN